MWVKKTDLEKIEEEKVNKKIRFKGSIKFGILIFLLIAIIWPVAAIIIGIVGSKNPATADAAMKISDLPKYIPGFLRLAAMMGVISFIFSAISKPKKRAITMMCDNCHETKIKDKETQCQCGGIFFDSDNFKWVEDQSV
jgi:hypothetical protein